MNEEPQPKERRQFDAQWLMDVYPPVWHNPNKRIVSDISCPSGSVHSGELAYTRWPAMPLTGSIDPREAAGLLVDRRGFYDYERFSEDSRALEWHVNFADPHLFVAYSSSLFAQDEMQVVEHPALGALKEALLASGLPVVTVEQGAPTPVLVRGVERRCRVETTPDASAGRPRGLYGNAFSQADGDVVAAATQRIDPPTTTNLIAMASLSPRSGQYTEEQVGHLLRTAYSAFRAAALESRMASGVEVPVVIHSGFWGCGAFGGDRTLMTTIQAIAAEMAGVAHLVVHTGDASGDEVAADVRSLLCDDIGRDGPLPTPDLPARLAAGVVRVG